MAELVFRSVRKINYSDWLLIGAIFYDVGPVQSVKAIFVSGMPTPSHLLGQNVKPKWPPMEGNFVRVSLFCNQLM